MKFILLIIAALASSVSRPAAAQEWNDKTTTGSRVQFQREQMEINDLRRIQRKFGNCVILRNRAGAERFLLQPINPDPSDRTKRIDPLTLANGQCLAEAAGGGSVLRFPGDTFRYALADSLVRTELGTVALTDLSRVAALEHPKLDETEFQVPPGKKAKPERLKQLADYRSREVARIYMSRIGECVVRADPSKVHALLASEPVSPPEKTAFAALRASLAGCVGSGTTITLDRVGLRGTLAYNYLRLSRALTAGTQPPVAKAR